MLTFRVVLLFIGLAAASIAVLLYMATERNRQYVKSRRRRDLFRLNRSGKRRRGIRIER